MAKKLGIQLPVSEFEKKDIEEQREIVVKALGKCNRVLIYADNYETVKYAISPASSMVLPVIAFLSYCQQID